MRRFSPPFSRLVHENLSVLMCFAYSRKPLIEMVEGKFLGEWKYLNKALFEISAERAEKACLELALFLRMLDDDENISRYHASTKNVPNCGKLVMKEGVEKVLTFREVANKVIHSSHREWDFTEQPTLVCYARPTDTEKWGWVRAEVSVVALAAVCSQLIS
jgi:hypothetical protein